MEPIHPRRGFTLIELLVVAAIILIVTAVTITSQSSFNKTIILANTAYDVALTMHSAENFGLGSRAVNGIVNAGYGVHFDMAVPNSFILFADTYPPVGSSGPFCHTTVGVTNGPGAIPGDCIYEPSSNTSGDQIINDYTLQNGITLNSLCVYSSSWSCSNTNTTLTTLDVVFARPNGDATISINGPFVYPSPYTKACIAVTSPQGGLRYVSVDTLGEISVSASTCS